jgi:hypothetical protein
MRPYSTGFMQRLFTIVGSIAVMPDVRSCSLRGAARILHLCTKPRSPVIAASF